MPKKPQQQAESNNAALSREDRKNEQICRMIERAEKLRLKKEQKKKLADINKATGKVGAPRKQKKLGLLSTKRTQVAIRILFNESVRAQNASNRYFFERKQSIEEKQRMEQEEMWARYALRVQQQQSQQAAHLQTQQMMAQQQMIGLPSPNMLPALHDNMSMQHHFMQPVRGIGQPAMSAMPRCNLISQQQIMVPQQQQHPAATSAPASQSGAAVQTQQQAERAFYLHDGATGGNYEAGIEDQSGSSYFSSASKRAQQQQPQENNAAGCQTATAPLPTAVSEPVARTNQLAIGVQPSQSLGSVLNSLHQQEKSNTSGEEEVKVGAAQASGASNSILIDVNLKNKKANDDKATSRANNQNQASASQGIADLATGTALRNTSSQMEDAAGNERKTEQQLILELTRQQMMQRRPSPSK